MRAALRAGHSRPSISVSFRATAPAAKRADLYNRRVVRAAVTLAIVIPAHNEQVRLGLLLRALPTTLDGIDRIRVIVVDDGSADETGAVARQAGAIVLTHRLNLGKGGALLTGCDAAQRLNANLIVTMDADGQHEPQDLPRLLAPLLQGQADVVLGTRLLAGQMPAAMRLGNHLLTATIRLFFGIAISDTQCGFRAFGVAAYPRLRWEAADYAVESEMLVHMARARLRYLEVPIATVYLDRYKGTQPIDGLRILRQLLVWRLSA